MIKTLLSITLISSALLLGCPQAAEASASIELIDVNQSNIIVVSGRNNVRVSGAAGKMLYIYDLSGKCVKAMRVDSADFHCDLSFLSKGIYLVKIGDVTRKLSIN